MPDDLKTVEITQGPLKMNAFIFHAGRLKDSENNPKTPENERVLFYAGQLKDTGNNPRAPENERVHF